LDVNFCSRWPRDTTLLERMHHWICAAAALFFTASHAVAQPATSWHVRGDTIGAPAGCSASAGVASIDLLITGIHRADSAGLAQALAPTFVFSVIPVSPTDTFVIARTIPQLLRYAEDRQKIHERVELEAVTFSGWRGRRLDFGPIYFLRSADDTKNSTQRGGGKGTYDCGRGITVFNLGRLPIEPKRGTASLDAYGWKLNR
jgi:hypothetical protein